MDAPTLLEALEAAKPMSLFRSTERLEPCPQVDTDARVDHAIELDIDFGKPVRIACHTSHIVSDTGRLTLRAGYPDGYVESIVGRLRTKHDRFEVEPLVIGAPWFEHPRNGSDNELMFLGQSYGEILPEDIQEFSKMKDIQANGADEWMEVMRKTSEEKVKSAFADLLSEPTKKDWGGEANDHFSSNVTVNGRRMTAAFLLKGPSKFKEMTLDMCGRRADQIHRLTDSAADISIVQHSHMIGEVVRKTLRSLTVYPGQSRKYCIIDGQSTYRILKAYSFV